MPAYAIAHLRSVEMNEEIVTYLERIDDSLAPHQGRFLIHGVMPEVVEEPFPGTLVVIEFPDAEQAHAWYRSDAYAEILPLRVDNSDSSAIVVAGVEPGYRAAGFAALVRTQIAAGG